MQFDKYLIETYFVCSPEKEQLRITIIVIIFFNSIRLIAFRFSVLSMTFY